MKYYILMSSIFVASKRSWLLLTCWYFISLQPIQKSLLFMEINGLSWWITWNWKGLIYLKICGYASVLITHRQPNHIPTIFTLQRTPFFFFSNGVVLGYLMRLLSKTNILWISPKNKILAPKVGKHVYFILLWQQDTPLKF